MKILTQNNGHGGTIYRITIPNGIVKKWQVKKDDEIEIILQDDILILKKHMEDLNNEKA